MATPPASTTAKDVAKALNKLNIKSGKLQVGDWLVNQATRQGVSVANAAGSNPTAAEFKALLDSLRNAGLIAP